MVNKGLCLKKIECVRFKSFERKIKSPFMIYEDLNQKIKASKIHMSLILKISNKNMLLSGMATN